MTEKHYKRYNILAAWFAFFIALLTYSLTVEPTVSLWDCGEFTASAYKLQVGHPPGAPLFMLIGRVFSLFAPSTNEVALMINYVSVVASAFTIFFLYLSITYFAKKLIIRNNEYKKNDIIAVLASGIIGALAYTFSDSFWFSAVEAEVYAGSSLFTALVFWAILKWETISNEKYSNRWLIFIAFMMGLSIGIHLLNLLAIPAIVFVYYFKKFKVNSKGIFWASVLSIVLILFVMYGIIQGYVYFAAKFELFFVNGLGLGFHSGLLFFIGLTAFLLIWGVYRSFKKKKIVLNTILTGITVILIGYSSFTVIVLRSYANPPMDENNPENVFSLLSYLNREQYGSRPLIYGHYYDTDFKRDSDGNVITKAQYTYTPDKDRYKRIEKTNPKYLYDSEHKTIFPRMYSRDQLHISAYEEWGNIDPDDRPNFINNMRFFISYQSFHMYFRYFFWNFSGRQNNLQSHGNILKGNAITGINFIDRFFIGNQSEITDRMKHDKSRNTYYLLPFILGLIGLFFTYKFDKQSFIVIFLLFFFTGIAIVMYLNQTPYQPRERDYAYAGSFYAFAIWIGLGFIGIYKFFKSKVPAKLSILISFIICLPVPTLMAIENWDDHDRSGRYTAEDMAKNYLDSCEENAILFTYGDNDTFPLWYVQDVEAYRTDIKVVNLSLLGTHWYIDQMRTQTYDAAPVPFKMESYKYSDGNRDILYITENPEEFINEKFQANEILLRNEFAKVKELLQSVLKNSTYKTEQTSDYELIMQNIQAIEPMDFAKIISRIAKNEFIEKYSLDASKVDELFSLTQFFLRKVSEEHLPLQNAMDFAASEKPNSKLPAVSGDRLNYLPSKKVSLEVPWPKVALGSTFTAEEMSKFEKHIKWEIPGSYLFKNDMAVLEILARNNWKRPIYFATSVPDRNTLGLKKYFRLEGFANRLVPFKSADAEVSINTDVMYTNLMSKFSWGRMNEDDVYLDNFHLRNFKVMQIRQTFSLLAEKLIHEGKNSKAIEVLDKCIELMPDDKVPFDFAIYDFANLYYIVDEIDKANGLIDQLITIYEQDLIFYNSLENRFKLMVSREKAQTFAYLKEFEKMTAYYKQIKQNEKIKEIIKIYLKDS